MNNPFQEQLLKAGLVNKKQVQKANQEKTKKHKQQRNKKDKPVNEHQIKAQQLAKEKTDRDRALNKQKEDQARQKAVSAEIDQLITNNLLPRDENWNIVYNFEHRKKIHRIYVDEGLKQKIIRGQLGIARIDGRYELIPDLIAEKVKQRNAKRVILLEKEFEKESTESDANDPYAEYQIPDDLTW